MYYNINMRNYSIDEALNLFHEDLFKDIILSPELMRLRNISFLGSIEKTENANKTSRFDHSIGVAYLAQKISEKLNIDSETRESLIIACLLHDIGHGPLSHSLEPVIKKKLHFDHSTLTKRLIVGTYRLNKKGKDNNIYKILQRHNIHRTKITSILSGKENSLCSLLFGNPFNLDTLDGISRVAFSLNLKYKEPEQIINLFYIKNGKIFIDVKDKAILDEFWDLKSYIYKNYIYSTANLCYELLLQKYYESFLRKEKKVSDFIFTDDNNLLSQFKNENYLYNMKKIILSHNENNSHIKHNLKTFCRIDNYYFCHNVDEIDLNDIHLIYKRDSKQTNIEVTLEEDKLIDIF